MEWWCGVVGVLGVCCGLEVQCCGGCGVVLSCRCSVISGVWFGVVYGILCSVK